MTKCLQYWQQVHDKNNFDSLDNDDSYIHVSGSAEMDALYKKIDSLPMPGTEFFPDFSNEYFDILDSLQILEKERRSVQRVIDMFFDYGLQKSTYSSLIQKKLFNRSLGFIDRLLIDTIKFVGITLSTVQEVVDKVADILNHKPIYHDTDLAMILKVIKQNHPSVDFSKLNLLKRPSLLVRFSSFMCCKGEQPENEVRRHLVI
jgi:hypothetical protein